MTSRRSCPSMVIRPAVGSHMRCSSDIAVDLPAPVWPTSATDVPGLRREVTGRTAPVCRCSDRRKTRPRTSPRRAAPTARGHCPSPGTLLRASRMRKKSSSAGSLKNSEETKEAAVSSRPISSMAKPMKLTISPTLAMPVDVQPGADHHDGDHRDRDGRARHHVHQRPPVQHRELMADHLIGDVAEQPPLGRQAGEGLHHHHVRERILRGAGQRGVQPLNPPLRGLRLAAPRWR